MSKIKAIGLIALAATLLLSGCQKKEESQQLLTGQLNVPEQVNYKTVTPKIKNYTVTSNIATELYYPLQVDLKWSDTNSRYSQMLVQSGDVVAEDQELMTFEKQNKDADMAELNLKLTRKQEEITNAKASRQAEITAAKEKLAGLTGHELRIAQLKVEKLEISYEKYVYQAGRELAAIQEDIDEVQEYLDDDTLVAPISGTIGGMASFDEGDKVESGVTVARIRSQKYLLKVKTNANKLRYNMKVVFSAGAGENAVSCTGTVISCPSLFRSDVGHNEAWILLDEEIDPNTVKQKVQCYCTQLSLKDVLVVDRSALYTEGQKYYVNILVDNTVQKRYVIPGLTNSTEAWIIDGLTEDQVLVLN